jgi:hypothetical protein
MRILPTLLFALSFALTQAQPFNWQWSLRDTATLSAPDVGGMTTDALGNTYITGQFYGTASFGNLPPITSLGQGDVYVVKYDASGEALWVVQGGGSSFDQPMDLAIDTDGHVYITGYFQSPTVTFGSTTLMLVGGLDIFVARVEASDGTFMWAKRFGGTGTSSQTEFGRAIACDNDGNVYVSGHFKNTLAIDGLATLESCSQYFNSFLFKLDPDGNGLWSRRPDCGQHWSYSASEGQAITVGKDNMLYLGLRARGDTIFCETDTLVNAQVSGQTYDGVVVKYDLDGAYQWSRAIGGYGYDDVKDLQADADGNLYVAMHREGEYYLGIPNIEVAGNLGTYRSVVLKYAADGQILWGTRMGNSTYDHDIGSLKLESDDRLLVGGWHQGNFEIGGVTPNPGITGTYGMFLARFDGESAMEELYASRYTYPRRIQGIGLDEGGNIYAAGSFSDSLAFPGLPAMGLLNASSSALFLARSGDLNTGVRAADRSNLDVKAYPSPTTGRFTIANKEAFSSVRVSTMLGAVVHEEAFLPRTTMDLSLSTAGMYTFTLRDGAGGQWVGRVLVE